MYSHFGMTHGKETMHIENNYIVIKIIKNKKAHGNFGMPITEMVEY